jgi:hypothetical protein
VNRGGLLSGDQQELHTAFLRTGTTTKAAAHTA